LWPGPAVAEVGLGVAAAQLALAAVLVVIPAAEVAGPGAR
jgi:hypothetical protein